jgi:hypothetical protein
MLGSASKIAIHAFVEARHPAMPCCGFSNDDAHVRRRMWAAAPRHASRRDTSGLADFPPLSAPIRRRVWCSLGKPNSGVLKSTKDSQEKDPMCVCRASSIVAAGCRRCGSERLWERHLQASRCTELKRRGCASRVASDLSASVLDLGSSGAQNPHTLPGVP